MPIIRRWWISSNSLSLTRHEGNLITGRSDPARYLLSLEHELWLFARVTKKGPRTFLSYAWQRKKAAETMFFHCFCCFLCAFYKLFVIHLTQSVDQFFADLQLIFSIGLDDDIGSCLVFFSTFFHQFRNE